MDLKTVFGMGKPDIKKMEKDKDIKGLIKLLKFTNDESVRRAAAFAIGKITDSNTMEYPNLKDENSDVKSNTEEYDSEIEEISVEKLIDSFKDEDWNVRKNGAKALGEIGEPAVEQLINALKDEKWRVRWQAAETLGEISDVRAIKPLINTLNDENNGVRSNSIIALVKIGEPTVELLINALKDKEWRVRWQAAETLGEIRDLRAIKPLINTLNDENNGVRSNSIIALVKIGEPTVELLINVLTDKEGQIRGQAAETLGEIGDLRAVIPLISTLKDENPWVRMTAVNALGNIGDARAVEPLQNVLNDENYDVQMTAAIAIEKLPR